jgi:hypothetical protein
MSDPKDTTSFFRKVVKFVANPTTEWAELGTPAEETRETEYAKGELKAMIERKRRNDFVRKREFDMLRKVRREGLTSEQLAALGGSSRIDDSEGRIIDSGAKAELGVKAKIDEIEQQMVGDAPYVSTGNRRTPEFYNAPTVPAAMDTRAVRPSSRSHFDAAPVDDIMADRAPPLGTSPVTMGGGVSPLSPVAKVKPPVVEPVNAFTQELTEIAHDPELDEAVIAFANADFDQCEQALSALTGPGGPRAQHAETWLVLFDLYRAIGERHKFEALALDYAQQFGWSAPQWYSLPQLVAEAASDERPPRTRIDGQVGWVCPPVVDADAVARLRTQTLQMPLPWVLDWGRLQSIDAEGCARLTELFRHWSGEALEMRWLSGEQLLTVLADAAPTGARDADPAYWLLRLEALRLAHRADQFDETAIDYCVTYEVSPPSWEKARCHARISGATASTVSPPLSVVSDASSSFVESAFQDEPGKVRQSSVELSGQLVGDIGATLAKMDTELGKADLVNVACGRLIRVDFIAAGDLLNWVLARRGENRLVSFTEAHRLVALFFGAMGINEHAKVKVRTV